MGFGNLVLILPIKHEHAHVVRLTPGKCSTNLSQHPLTPTIWSDVRVEIKSFFFTFLEVNMSNIL
jgi:hypothetical protein